MTAKQEILNRLRARRREEAHPAPWQLRRQFDDLAARFTQALTAAHGEVFPVVDVEAALAQLGDVLTELQVQQAAVNDDLPLAVSDLSRRWPQIDWQLVGQSEEDLRAFCAQANVGISGVEAALAETGTLVVGSGPKRSRLVTLLPPVHVALVKTSQLLPDIFAWTAVRPQPMPANTVFISGPSKTADIEQTMAVGVHGPRRLLVILINDVH